MRGNFYFMNKNKRRLRKLLKLTRVKSKYFIITLANAINGRRKILITLFTVKKHHWIIHYIITLSFQIMSVVNMDLHLLVLEVER